MFMKIIAMYHLNKRDLTVTWSDCDVLWLRPFMEDWILPYANRTNFLSQKALHPSFLSKRSGSVICTGLLTVFPSAAAKAALSLLVSVTASYRLPSDQYLINQFLASLGIFRFEEKFQYYDIDSPQVVLIPHYTGSYPKAKIIFLPSAIFPRSRTDLEWAQVLMHDPAVWHSKTDKVGQSKIDGMKNSLVFVLKDGWENMTDSSQVVSFVDNVLLSSRSWKRNNVTEVRDAKSTIGSAV